MGVADRLILNRAQTEALRGVIGRGLEPSIIEDQHFGLAVFQEQLAVVGAFQPARQSLVDRAAIETGPVDKRGNGWVHGDLFLCGAFVNVDKASVAIWR